MSDLECMMDWSLFRPRVKSHSFGIAEGSDFGSSTGRLAPPLITAAIVLILGLVGLTLG